MANLCPVCGNPLEFQPWKKDIPSHEICPSCGIHFGYDDAAGGSIEKRKEKYNEWRKNWIKNGMQWFSSKENKPENWDPNKQLKNLEKIKD